MGQGPSPAHYLQASWKEKPDIEGRFGSQDFSWSRYLTFLEKSVKTSSQLELSVLKRKKLPLRGGRAGRVWLSESEDVPGSKRKGTGLWLSWKNPTQGDCLARHHDFRR